MEKYAVLCGSAPAGFRQRKIEEMHRFLLSASGGSWAEQEIMIFPNGVTEEMLLFALRRLKKDKKEHIFLYICTNSPVKDSDKSVWLGGDKIGKDIFQEFLADGIVQVIFEWGKEIVSEEEFAWEKAL